MTGESSRGNCERIRVAGTPRCQLWTTTGFFLHRVPHLERLHHTLFLAIRTTLFAGSLPRRARVDGPGLRRRTEYYVVPLPANAGEFQSIRSTVTSSVRFLRGVSPCAVAASTRSGWAMTLALALALGMPRPDLARSRPYRLCALLVEMGAVGWPWAAAWNVAPSPLALTRRVGRSERDRDGPRGKPNGVPFSPRRDSVVGRSNAVSVSCFLFSVSCFLFCVFCAVPFRLLQA